MITATREREKQPLQDDSGLVRWVFEETPPLPSYLIAFAVGPLDIVEVEGGALPPNDVRKAPLPFRGVAAKGKGARLRYALENTAPLLTSLERYFGEPYPFSKLDVIAVPDFSSGAMENVGAITFREYLLLVDEETAPITQKQAFAAVMAHELAHMWFGNVVTMPWWDDIWLNEAFATWMAYKVVHEVHPRYELDVSLKERVLDAMRYDSLLSARQIRQPIESDHDIRNAFDSITYSKGGGVLSMFETWLSEDTFKEGVRAYVKKHRFGSATYEDLLTVLGETAEKDVATPFKTFLFQPGVPLLDLDVSCEEGKAPTLRVAQARYLPTGSLGDAKQSWRVPVCVRFQDGRDVKKQCVLVEEPSASIELKSESCPAWLVPNVDGAGYYSWSLPTTWLDKIPFAKLPTKERLDYADSLRAAFTAGRLDAAEVMQRLSPLAADPHRAVALAPLPVVRLVVEHVVPEAEEDMAKAWARKLYRPALRRLGYQPRAKEDPSTTRLRADVLELLALFADDKDAQQKLAALGRGFLAGKGKVAPELVPLALRAAMRTGDATLFDEMLLKLKETDDALLRSHLIGALASAEDEQLSARARELTLDPALRGNEVYSVLAMQASREETRKAAFGFLRDNWTRVLSVMPTTQQGWVPWIFASFCQRSDAKEVREFMTGKIDEVIGGPRNLDGALEAIELCAARVERHRDSAVAFLRGAGPLAER